MMRTRLLLSSLSLAALLLGCEPKTVEPELVITAMPRTIDGAGQKSTLEVLLYDDKGEPGVGAVKLSSSAGSLKSGDTLQVLAGRGTIDFSCSRVTDPNCLGNVQVTAEWVTGDKTVTRVATITVSAPVVVRPDAGLTISATRRTLGIGLGQVAEIEALHTLDGVPAPDASVSITTTLLGQLVATDGGVFTSPAVTDATGRVVFLLREAGAAGQEVITAEVAGRSASTEVSIYVPDGGLTVSATPQILTLGFNEQSAVTINHRLENRAIPGRPIEVETSVGRLLELDGGRFVSPALTDTNGQIQLRLIDTGTPGIATVTARDTSANLTASTAVTLAAPDAGVVLEVPRPTLYLGINDSVPVTATLYANGNPTPNRALNVETTLGSLTLRDGGVFSGQGSTDATGKLELTLRDNAMQGPAVITASDPVSARSDTKTVNIRPISTVNFVQMVCSGQPCTVLGIKSSNFRTTAKLQFRVLDNQTTPQPVANVPVSFSIALSSAAGTSIAPSQTVTDATGLAEVTVNTDNAVGTFNVTATVIPGVAATSPSFGVRGAKPSSQGFQLICNKTTLAAYSNPVPGVPLPITADCTATLNDRFGNPVGLPTDISFRAEAGAIPASQQTPEFSMNTMANEGKTTVTFNTVGAFPAKDVAPLTAFAGQYPAARIAEISRQDGALTRNPRDGLVVVIAWASGEEWFNDLNGNGVRDPNEPFTDQGEPFLDTNDNDVFDGEDVSFNVDGDGVYDPPNGVWDANAFVWTKTYLLYTDQATQPLFSSGGSPPSPVPPALNVPKGGQQTYDLWFADLNLNRVERGSSISVSRTSSRGTLTTNFLGYDLESFGFDLVPRMLLNEDGTGPCSTALTCRYFTRFGNWERGPLGSLTITGVAGTDMTPSQLDNITVRVTTRGAQANMPVISGTIQ